MFSFSKFQNLESAYPIIKETVPMTDLGYKTNNKYPNFPPLMSDGRSITATWQPESTINADLIERNNIKSNWEYRKFMTDNATEIMKYNFTESSNDIGYYKRPIDIPSIQNNTTAENTHIDTPYYYSSIMDNSRPNGYESSNLKEQYLSREQLDANKLSPAITQDKLLSMKR